MKKPEELGWYGWPDQETWFESLQAGDEVMVERRYGKGSTLTPMKVKNRTPQGKVRLENGDMYDRWCRITYSTYLSYHIRPVTDPEHDALERQYFIERIRALNLEELHLEVLRKIVKCL